MARFALLLAITAAALGFLFPKTSDVTGWEIPHFLDLILALPAVVLGSRSWWRTRTFGRSWPAVLCLLVVWLGLIGARQSESNRAYLIAAYLTVVLPIGALIVERRLWWLCARTFVYVSGFALAVTAWFEYRAHHGAVSASLVRFGYLLSDDGGRYMSNPNQVGGQMAFAAVLALVLYLRDQTVPPGTPGRRSALHFALVPALAAGCMLTASRGAFAAWFAGTALLLLLGTKQLSPTKLRDLLVVCAMLLCTAMLAATAGGKMPWDTLSRRLSGSESDEGGLLGSRELIWKSAIHAWWTDPKYCQIGAGTGMADEVLGQYDTGAVPDAYGVPRRSSHSVYIEWLLSYGLLGLVPGVFLAALAAFKARALDRRDGGVGRQALLAAVVLYAATAVLCRQPWWIASGALVVAMLSEPRAGGRSAPSATAVRGTPALPRLATGGRQATPALAPHKRWANPAARPGAVVPTAAKRVTSRDDR